MKKTITGFSTTIFADQGPEEVFSAINNVRGWWSEDLEGSTEKINGVFTVRFGEVFITSKVIGFIPGRKIVWRVTDCNKPWLKNKKEWVGTEMSFEIAKEESKTKISFVHLGLIAELECFDVCANAWSQYIGQSLWSLIVKGTGKPTPKSKTAAAK